MGREKKKKKKIEGMSPNPNGPVYVCRLQLNSAV